MQTIFQAKEQPVADTPLLIFDCELSNGSVERWSTHGISLGAVQYAPRVIKHNLFEIQTASDQGVDTIPRLSVDLANSDSHFSELERSTGWKGARLSARFLFYDLRSRQATTDVAVLFQGIANSPELITETTFRLSAINRMSMQRVTLPEVRIQRRCSWDFPATLSQRQEALDGGPRGKYSRYFRCGYSADVPGGVGNLNAGAPFTSCSFTRADCEARGMFSKDSAGNATARFNGIEFVPSTILVRSAGESGKHLSAVSDNEARYNDFVPLLYGTAWFSPSIVFARNDGNLTRMEVLLGMGELESVVKVLVNNNDIPIGHAGLNMTGTGWFNTISLGTRNGTFNPDFSSGSGVPLGDPYGSMAFLSVVVPNRINDGLSLPSIKVLVQGAKLASYQEDGTLVSIQFSNNPAWIILDLLLRSGWGLEEIDLASFAQTGAYCGELIDTQDLHGNTVQTARFQCNLALQSKRSAGDVIRGIRNSARLYLTFGFNALLQLRVENSTALQQPSKPAGSNATESLDGGWPAYEFGDGSSGTTGILRLAGGASSVKLSSRNAADCPNRFTTEFQDAFNEYQQDSSTLVDADDVAKTGQEISATVNSLGIANYDQAFRILKFNLDKSVQGNTHLEFQTSVKALGLRPGDLISFTYLKEGFSRQPFRIEKIAPGPNFRTVTITAQIHQDQWYYDSNGQTPGGASGRMPFFGIGLPRPIIGTTLDINGELVFDVTESSAQAPDGTTTITASVGFILPGNLQPGAPTTPLISLAALVSSTGGTVADKQVLYFAVSCVNSAGQESPLSFVVRANVDTETETNTVTLTGLSFPASAVAFHVYRGLNPSQLYRIASNIAIAVQFLDNGLAVQPEVPPDPNFDHVNFYWRLELQPEAAGPIHSASSIGNSALRMLPDEYKGMTVRVTRGLGAHQERRVDGNSDTVLKVSPDWDIEPDATSSFVVAQSGFQFGATGHTNRLQFEIPNRAGAIVEISGRSANVNDMECAYEISPLTRWLIGGGGIQSADQDVPPAPVFGLGLAPERGGTVEFGAVAFSDLKNTSTISAGTYTLHYVDELNGIPALAVASAVTDQDTVVNLNSAGAAVQSSFIQIDSEIMQVEDVLNEGLQYQVARAAHGTTAAAHSTGTVIYGLNRTVTIVPFIRNFFGSPSSGSWIYPFSIPNVRIASAELFVSNSQGNSPTAILPFTNTVDYGLRTLSGGQFSFQIAGYLASQTNSAPDIIVDTGHAIRDVYAIVNEAPQSSGIHLNLNLNGSAYCSLSFAAGVTTSSVVDGLGLAPLNIGDRLSLDITAVGSAVPGRDLTVIIRL
ncbi:MAG: phage tail protein [Bryobacteraceae bacterium]